MKRTTIFFGAVCCSLMLTAEPISKQAALYTAQAYMLAKGKNINTTQKPFKAPRKAATTNTSADENEAYYYVFNAGNDNGYVIISGDDRTESVLGYVDKGSFDPNNIPENMRSWLQFYSDQIKYIVDNDIQPNSPLLKRPNKISATKHSIAELLTTRWNQGHPYNLTCPQYYDEKTGALKSYPAAGCVATAMAQVINFYRFPEKTKAIIPAHSCTYTLPDGTKKTINLRAIPRNTVIDWENMRDTYNCNNEHVHDRPDTAVANLMLYMGQSVKMGYGASSGASTSRSRDVFVNYFGFDNCAYWGGRGDFTIDDWFDRIYSEIDAGYPVLYAGHSSGGGHAFVLDGFDGENLFHVNWGWGGGSNGWFLVSILNPGDNSGIGASSSSDGYSMSQGALFGLRLPREKIDTHLNISDVSIVGSSVKAVYTNKTHTTGPYNVAIVTIGEDGRLVPASTVQNISSLANNASQSKTFTLKGKLPEGTYKLSPASKLRTSDVWHPAYNMMTGQYIEAVVDSLGEISMNLRYPTTEIISIDTIVFPGTRIQKKEQEVKVTFRNDGKEYFRTVYLLASKTQNKVYTESKSMVSVRSGETVDVSYFFTPDTTGTYNLWFATDDKGNNVIGEGTIEVITEAEAVKANLSVSSYTISNLVNGIAYGKQLVGKVSIKNNGSKDFHGNIKLQLWSQKVGNNTAYSSSSRTYYVDILAGKTAILDFEFDNLSEGYYYRLPAYYVSQGGNLSNGGLWDHRWEMKAGVLTWKSDGTITGKAYSSNIAVGTTACGFYANCNKINRLTPNRYHTNTIYAFAPSMDIPATLDEYNVVKGNHADRIDLVNDEPYYIPVSFDADSASFTYTFEETEAGTGWHAFTMPFQADSIFLDDIPVELDDTLNHFWIYEFAEEGGNGEAIFEPAKVLRAGNPYIIAGDAKMAGRSIVFRSNNVPFFKTGTDKMVVTSPNYRFHGNTFSPKLKDCYIMNAEGTAFEHTTSLKAIPAMASYFTTNFVGESIPDSIPLPEIPASPTRKLVLDEMAENVNIEANMYDELTLKRTFEAGWNTICLPFQVNNIEETFGEGTKAYEFCGFVEGELDFCIVDSIVAGQPYVVYVPNAVSEDIVLSDIIIRKADTQAGFINKSGARFRGSYERLNSDIFSMELRKLTAEGTLVSFGPEDELGGFRAVFHIPAEAEATLHLYDDPTGIKHLNAYFNESIYNLSGQRLSKPVKGINVMNGKKILR